MTGVDYGNCYLQSDPQPSIKMPKFVTLSDSDFENLSNPSTMDFTNSTQHSKIISYIAFNGESDFRDESNGMGTYLAGVIAGKYGDEANIERSQYNGIAPDAQLVVMDTFKQSAGFIEKDLYKELRWSRHATGARIHLVPSHSSQAMNPGYTTEAMQIDQFLYEHNTSIVVAPSGDFSSTASVGTISSPGTSKNAIVVGSVFGASNVILEAALDKYYIDRSGYNRDDISSKSHLYSSRSVSSFSSRGITSDARHKPDVVLPGEFVIGARSNGDSGNRNCDFSYRGGNGATDCPKDCSGHGQCVNAHCQCSQGYCGNDCSVVTDSSRTRVSCCANDCNARGICLQDTSTTLYTECSCTNSTQTYGLYCLNTFSELAGNKGFNVLQVVPSTTTAAAVGAALIAITRQYFLEGFYPSGAPIAANKMEPTNSLIKALFVNGARQASQVVSFDDNKRASSLRALNGTVTPEAGNGLVALDKVLPIAGHSTFRLLAQQSESLSTGQVHSRCYKIIQGGEFKATLAWTDPPSATTNSKHLINNLDLEVIVANKRYLGNQLTTILDPNSDPVEIVDQTNNAESVYVSNVRENDRIRVTVKGTFVSEAFSPQVYSLVLTGHFEGDSSDFCPECYVGEQLECATSIGRGYRNCTGSGFFSGDCIMTECYTGYSLVDRQCELGSFIRTSKNVIQILEGERSAFQVILVDAPTSDVRVTITAPSSGRRVRVKSATETEYHESTVLSFTALDWSIPQRVYVKSIMDHMANGDYSGSITIETESSDFNFNTRQVKPVEVILEETDKAFVIASKHNVQLLSPNQIDIVKLSLNTTPSAPVYIHYEVPDALRGVFAFQTEQTEQQQVSSVIMQLNETNWNTNEAQLLLIMQEQPESTTSALLWGNVTSSDSAYHNTIVPPLIVNLVASESSTQKNRDCIVQTFYVGNGASERTTRSCWMVVLGTAVLLVLEMLL